MNKLKNDYLNIELFFKEHMFLGVNENPLRQSKILYEF